MENKEIIRKVRQMIKTTHTDHIAYCFVAHGGFNIQLFNNLVDPPKKYKGTYHRYYNQAVMAMAGFRGRIN